MTITILWWQVIAALSVVPMVYLINWIIYRGHERFIDAASVALIYAALAIGIVIGHYT